MLRSLRGYMHSFAPNDRADSEADVLTYYLDLNKYHGVMSPQFKQLMLGRRVAPTDKTEEGKQFAIRDFVEHVIRIGRERGLEGPISVGFSDDDVGNARAVETYIHQELSRQFPSVKFVVYYTADPDMPSGRKVVVQGQLTLGLEKP